MTSGERSHAGERSNLAIAATANVHGVPLLTADTKGLTIINDLVQVQALD